MSTAESTDSQLAQFKAQFAEMKKQNEMLSQNLEKMQTSYADANKPRLLNAFKSWQAHKIGGIEDYKEDIAKMFGEQEYSPIAGLLENLTQLADGKNTELERVTKAMQDRETELKAKDEENTKLREAVDKYQSAIQQDGQYDAGVIFQAHRDLVNTPLDGQSSSVVTTNIPQQQQQQQPVEVTNSRATNSEPSRKRARNGRLMRPGQQGLLEALNGVPLMTHRAIADLKNQH